MNCRWPDCGKKVPDTRWLCKEHYYLLPYGLRMKVQAVIKKTKSNRDPVRVEKDLVHFALTGEYKDYK